MTWWRRDARPEQQAAFEPLLREQLELARQVRLEDDFPDPPRILGGFDVAYEGDVGHGALVLLDAHTLEAREVHHARVEVDIPYVPGFLGPREFPVAKDLWRRIGTPPDVLLVDGSGVLHPRGLGSASHLGVKLDVPTIGVTKRRLHGKVAGKLEAPGDVAPVQVRSETLGHAYWSSPRATRPIFVSPGHRVSVASALRIVQSAMKGYKLPEPVRLADAEAARGKRR